MRVFKRFFHRSPSSHEQTAKWIFTWARRCVEAQKTSHEMLRIDSWVIFALLNFLRGFSILKLIQDLIIKGSLKRITDLIVHPELNNLHFHFPLKREKNNHL